jgi:hypothetical protein
VSPSGRLCGCGCGQVPPFARRTRLYLGTVKGEPIRFVPGHANHFYGVRPPTGGRFKKGMPQPRGAQNHNWKGDDVRYESAHLRLGSAREHACKDCGKPAQEWSLKKDTPQSRVQVDENKRRRGWTGVTFSTCPTDYEPRCKRCHRKYDGHAWTGEKHWQRRRKALATVATALLAVIMLTACATPGKVMVAPLWAPKLTPAEQQEADVIESAFARFVEYERARGAVGLELPRIIITSAENAHGNTVQGIITLPRRALSPGPNNLFWHIVAAHEGGHAYWENSRNCVRGRLAPCEWTANYHAVEVLVYGFGYDEPTAARLVHNWLIEGALHARPSPGHEDLCLELHEYERMTQWTTGLYPCTELAKKVT